MQHFSQATLIYVAQGKRENGSPVEESYSRCVKVKEIKTFSLNFYTQGDTTQRSMRNSKNLVVSKWLTDDYFDRRTKKHYELLYVDYEGLRYHVRNILNYRNGVVKAQWERSSLKAILDIEELR